MQALWLSLAWAAHSPNIRTVDCAYDSGSVCGLTTHLIWLWPDGLISNSVCPPFPPCYIPRTRHILRRCRRPHCHHGPLFYIGSSSSVLAK
ncbi:hypothetical protein F4803DRAFT_379080 [Xylaria telfairii]|nr:hypothetical protein F4803DRAFT_379080 [Xylaria telfairii]